MVSGNRGNCILKLKRRPSAIEKGVSLCREEPLLASKKHPLHLQTIVFTPLSIRRGVGGEAVVGLGERLLLICKQWSSLPSPFGEGLGVRLLLICKQWFSLPSPFGEGLGERL